MSEILSGNSRLEEAARGGPSIKARPVKEDADAVCRIQTALAYLSYVMPKSFSNGPFSDPDGIFGQETEDIVRVFQQTNFLKSTSRMGWPSWGENTYEARCIASWSGCCQRERSAANRQKEHIGKNWESDSSGVRRQKDCLRCGLCDRRFIAPDDSWDVQYI